MSDNSVPESPQPSEPPPVKPRAPRATQDQADANLINTYRIRLIAVQGHGEAVAQLTPRGFDSAGLAEGLAACDTAQTRFNAREIAADNKRIAAKVLKAADTAARAGYAGFSRIAAKVFKDNPTAKAAVVIPSRQIQDQDKFLTFVEGAYNTAMSRSTYQAALNKRGYTADALQSELAKLKAWSKASADYEAAVQASNRTTAERKAAVKALQAWWAEFYATAQVALKDRPDLLGLLES